MRSEGDDRNPGPAPKERSDGGLSWTAEEGGYSLLPFSILTELKWRDHPEDGYIEVYRPPRDKWTRVRDHSAPVLEGLARGETLPQLARSSAAAMPERPSNHIRLIIRKLTSQLVRWNMAKIHTPDPPERFNDRYEVVRELGRGGMGVLWHCRDLAQGGRDVAVKHAWNWYGAFEMRQRYLREEAEMLARLDHPGIVRHIETFEHDGRLHVARELLDGPSLEDLSTQGGIPEGDRLDHLEAAIQSLAHIIDRGYLCLDIKAENFMLHGPHRRVKLMDLGLCRRLDNGAAPVGPGVPGTRGYAAPELIDATEANERCTVYSLGRLHWRLITGQPPRARASLDSYFEQHRLDLEALEGTDATDHERDLIARCTDPRPENRPPTLEALREELR